jgi:hypothetical protein
LTGTTCLNTTNPGFYMNLKSKARFRKHIGTRVNKIYHPNKTGQIQIDMLYSNKTPSHALKLVHSAASVYCHGLNSIEVGSASVRAVELSI